MEGHKTLVFSVALEGYSSLFKSCIKSQKQYCERFGFKYILIDKAPRTLIPKEAAWLKLFLLRSALKSDYSWVAFIDADCEIRDHAPSFVKSFEKFQNEKSIFMGHGFSGRINSGVIFLKNTDEAKEYLNQVILHGDQAVPDEDKALYENGHMIYYGKDNPDVQIIDSVKWNNNVAIDDQSYIQHYSGGILRQRYLQKNPFLKLKYLFLKRIKFHYNRIFSKKRINTNMQVINALVDFYTNKYPKFRRDSEL